MLLLQRHVLASYFTVLFITPFVILACAPSLKNNLPSSPSTKVPLVSLLHSPRSNRSLHPFAFLIQHPILHFFILHAHFGLVDQLVGAKLLSGSASSPTMSPSFNERTRWFPVQSVFPFSSLP